MSTKIYDAYVLDKNYSMYELNMIMDELRREVTQICDQNIFDLVIKKCLYFYYFKKLHGEDTVSEMIEKTKDNKEKQKIWKAVQDEEWRRLFTRVFWETENVINNQYDRKFCDPDFKCRLQIFPMEDKILVMYFGNTDIRNFIEEQKYFFDYHYQDQTDKPDKISRRTWKQREKDWDKAIGPDYIPAHHGFCVDLYDSTYIMPSLNHEFHVPDQKDMLEELRDTMTSISSVEGYPRTNDVSVFWKFFRTPAYKEWKTKANEEILAKCNLFTNPEDIKNLFVKKNMEVTE